MRFSAGGSREVDSQNILDSDLSGGTNLTMFANQTQHTDLRVHGLTIACVGNSITRGDAAHEPAGSANQPTKSATRSAVNRTERAPLLVS